jgi:TRAP-type C4-dicarboxylate transport system permease small subunit
MSSIVLISATVLITTLILINSIITLCYLGTDYKYNTKDQYIKTNDWKRRYLISISYCMICLFCFILFYFLYQYK